MKLFCRLILILSGLLIFPLQIAAENTSAALPVQHQFKSSEILIKVRKEYRKQVKSGNPGDTGIASMNEKNRIYKVKKFEKIAKAGKNSDTGSEIFSWYKISLDQADITIASPGTINRGILENPVKSDNNSQNQLLSKYLTVLNSYLNDPAVIQAEPNYQVNTGLNPNDPYFPTSGSWGQAFPDMWGMSKIQAGPSWDQTSGNPDLLIAVIDTGVDRNHPDIAANMWTNTAEIPANNIDDDNNGYIDDFYGCNFINMTGNKCGDPMDDYGHGSHCAGTIAAVGNNSLGVVGVNWKAKIMALKFLNNSGSGFLEDGARAVIYAADMGAKITSNSWGGGMSSQILSDAFDYAVYKGVTNFAAAGNSNTDALSFSPANSDSIITVAASDYQDAKAGFSNYGEKIDITAPGVNILSIKAALNPMCDNKTGAVVGSIYCQVSGTSMATPHAAGVAALLLSKNPQLKPEEIRQLLRIGSDDLGAAGKDQYFGFGRLNALKSLNLANTRPLTPYITNTRSRTKISGTVWQITGGVPGDNFAGYKIEIGQGRTPASWTTVATSTIQVTDGLLGNIDLSKFSDNLYTIRLTATDTTGKTYQYQIFDLELDNFDVTISFPLGLIPLGTVSIQGTAQTKNSLPFGSYQLEYGQGSSPTSWSSTGISIENNGQTAVNNGRLATWNTQNLIHGQIYTLRLTVRSANGLSTQFFANQTADREIVNGWPKIIPNYFDQTYLFADISPVSADLNNDGAREIIIPGPEGKLYVFNKDGSDFPGFPVNIMPGDFYQTLNYSVNIADLDRDGKKEIVLVSHDSNYSITNQIHIVRSDGSFYPSWPRPAQPNYQTRDIPPLIYDLNNDGNLELIFFDIQTYVYATYVTIHAMHTDGSEIAGFPKKYTLPETDSDETMLSLGIGSTPSVFDLDRDGKAEIAWSLGSRIYLFDDQGNILPGWPYIVPAYNNIIMVFNSGLPAGDLDGDGNLELIAQDSIGCNYTGPNSAFCQTPGDSVVYAFKKDGSVLPGWPRTTATDGFKSMVYDYPNYSPSVADLNNDGKDEVVLGGYPMMVMNNLGKIPLSGAQYLYSGPALADIDGDNKLDIASSANGQILIQKLNSTGFSSYWSKNSSNYGNNITFNTPLILSDLDNNQKIELAAAGRATTIAVDRTVNISVYLWEIPGGSGTIPGYEWPMYANNAARTGRLTDVLPVRHGDANGDGVVNFSDLAQWLAGYLKNLTGITNGDFDNSGDITGKDYIIWSNNYTK